MIRLTALLVAAATLLFANRPVTAQTEETIRVGTSIVEQGVPIIYAVKAGLYKAAGLNVEVQTLGGAAAVTAALVGGSLEIGRGSTAAVVTAIGKGLPLTIIGGNSFYDAKKPNIALLVAADSTVRTPKDLEGKTLAATSLQDFNTLATFVWLERLGVDRNSLKYVEVPPSATMAAMDQKRVVGSAMLEPFYSSMVATGRVRVIGYPYNAIADRFADAVLFANVKWAAEHPSVVQRFLRATQEASTYVAAHENVAVELLSQQGGFDPAAFKSMHHSDLGVALSPADVQPVINVAAKYGIIPKQLQASEIICSCATRR
jgi:NitT/TauT family transport system substrate-binding protein